jgi:hypothetical protein
LEKTDSFLSEDDEKATIPAAGAPCLGSRRAFLLGDRSIAAPRRAAESEGRGEGA